MPLLRIQCRSARFLALVTLVLWGAVACAGPALRREIRDTPRDPQTGIVLGAEAVSLDPPAGHDAPTTACLLIHGFIASRHDFADFGERLAAAGFHVRMLRLPGHGTTPPDFRAQTPETLRRAVADEFRALRRQYRAVYVIGFSMGGALATLQAEDGKVDRLVLAAPYYGIAYRWYYLLPGEWWCALLSPCVDYLVRPASAVFVNRPEARGLIQLYRCVPLRGADSLIELGRRARRPDVLGAIRCPTLMIMSPSDAAASPKQARQALAGMTRAPRTVRWVPRRNNHQLFWDYDREEVKRTIVKFLINPSQTDRRTR